MITRALRFTGRELEINYSTGAAGSVRVEIQDTEGEAIPGYALDDCDEIIGDQIERAVSWKGERSVVSLAEKPVRLRFVMKDADLYALCFNR